MTTQDYSKVTHHKDEDPKKTITRIRKILDKLKISVMELYWNKVDDNCYSVRLEIDGLPGVGVNGKGTTYAYALASAYAEMMERLQNRILLSTSYGMKARGQMVYPADEKKKEDFDIKGFLIENPIFQSFFKGGLQDNVLEILVKNFKNIGTCSPFWNATSGEIQYIPTELVNLTAVTNGMSSGNTPEEAIVHGICEVIERYVFKKIIDEGIALPSIPLETFEGNMVFSLVEKLQANGYTVIVKDCTLGGEYPVIGLLVINKEKNRYIFKIGCDLYLDIVLERCVSELFQGIPIEHLNEFMFGFDWDAPLSINHSETDIVDLLNKRDKMPNSLFIESKPDPRFKNPFLNEYIDNKTDLNHLKQYIENKGYTLFIRDISYLGFPSYNLYIPGMSELYLIDEELLNKHIRNRSLGNDLLNLSDKSVERIRELAELLAVTLENQKEQIFVKSDIFRYLRLVLKPDNPLVDLDLRFLAALFHLRIAEYEKASSYLSQYLKNMPPDQYDNIDYYMCASAYLRFKAEGISDDKISDTLIGLFGEDLYNLIIGDIAGDHSGVLQFLELPTCAECKGCPLSEHCCFDNWQQINNTLIEQMEKVKIDQSLIKNIF